MTRKECLDRAAECVLRDRASQYGGVEDNFGRIALFWTDYLGVKLDEVDVAMMMALLKIARVRNNKSYEDGYIDLAGYAACGAELSGAMQAREDAVREAGNEYRRLRAECVSEKPSDFRIKTHVDEFFKAEGNCFHSGNSSEFKPGDKVQVLTSDEVKEWRDATYVSFCQMTRDLWRHEIKYADGGRRYVPREWIRLAPKAEGCEELAFDEARMRESMPGIVSQDGPSDMDAPEPELKPGDRIRVHFTGEEPQNGTFVGEGPLGNWTCRVKTDDGREGAVAKSIVKKLNEGDDVR